MHMFRTHTCGALRSSDVGSKVKLSGWIHSVRDHGGVIFIDLRDHYGKTQVVIDPKMLSIGAGTDGASKPSSALPALSWQGRRRRSIRSW